MDERIITLYEEHAAAWDRQRGRDLHERAWLDRFLALLPEGGRIVDIGCGSGEPIARYFVERGFGATGIDSSESLIALCRARMPEQEWIVADMRRLDLARRFHGLIAWHSFFHLGQDDQRAMFARFAAHAEPGAALMFTSGPEAGEAIGEWQSEPLFHASLDPGEYESLLADNGFTLVARRLRDPECGEATVWLARMTERAAASRTAAASMPMAESLFQALIIDAVVAEIFVALLTLAFVLDLLLLLVLGARQLFRLALAELRLVGGELLAGLVLAGLLLALAGVLAFVAKILLALLTLVELAECGLVALLLLAGSSLIRILVELTHDAVLYAEASAARRRRSPQNITRTGRLKFLRCGAQMSPASGLDGSA